MSKKLSRFPKCEYFEGLVIAFHMCVFVCVRLAQGGQHCHVIVDAASRHVDSGEGVWGLDGSHMGISVNAGIDTQCMMVSRALKD